jgi:hypothetical protein
LISWSVRKLMSLVQDQSEISLIGGNPPGSSM